MAAMEHLGRGKHLDTLSHVSFTQPYVTLSFWPDFGYYPATVYLKLTSTIKLTAGLVVLGILVVVMLALLIPLLPWRAVRIRLTNRFGTVIGRAMMWISRCPVRIEGREHVSADRPAIYVGNHTSILDAFTSIWLAPVGTVGVAKKQIVYYPFYGQAWLLSGHLLIDRSNPARAKASLRTLADFVRRRALHIYMWPEGTRSSDGRLQPFKKGIVHLAVHTGLPIVPMVTVGAHRAWERSSLTLRAVPIKITFLTPIDTTAWTDEHIEEHLEEIRRAFLSALPPDQQPHAVLELSFATAGRSRNH